ncbi:MAG TPA: hypothetical protein VGC64_05350, partial [Pyrinomonadaceae bacterium]
MPILKRVMRAAFMMLLSSNLIAAQGRRADVVHPIYDVDGSCLLGGTLKGKWLGAQALVPLMKGGERYRAFMGTQALGEATGGQPTSWGDTCEDSFTIKFTPSLEERRGVLAIGGDWNALPRTPQLINTSDPAYRKLVAALLRSKGIRRPDVQLARIMRVDLDDDGVDEVLVSATRYLGGVSPTVHAGDYSFVLLRKVVRGRVRNIMINEEYYPTAKRLDPANEYQLLGALDVNGDGV